MPLQIHERAVPMLIHDGCRSPAGLVPPLVDRVHLECAVCPVCGRSWTRQEIVEAPSLEALGLRRIEVPVATIAERASRRLVAAARDRIQELGRRMEAGGVAAAQASRSLDELRRRMMHLSSGEFRRNYELELREFLGRAPDAPQARARDTHAGPEPHHPNCRSAPLSAVDFASGPDETAYLPLTRNGPEGAVVFRMEFGRGNAHEPPLPRPLGRGGLLEAQGYADVAPPAHHTKGERFESSATAALELFGEGIEEEPE